MEQVERVEKGADATSKKAREGWKLIQQGAEARIYKADFFGRPSIVKERFVKSYRVLALDQKLTQRRMSQEVRSMARCRKNGIRAPAVYHLDPQKRVIVMEEITEGLLLKEHVFHLNPGDKDAPASVVEAMNGLVAALGRTLARLHDADIIHGDLTTSNLFFNPEKGTITFLDFGLSFVSGLAEDKGVDLYVLERAFLSTHPCTESFFERLLESYSKASKNGKSVIHKLDEVRMRGRKRSMVG